MSKGNKNKELSHHVIGVLLERNGIILEPHKWVSCTHCYYYKKKEFCSNIPCDKAQRKDGRSVIFIEHKRKEKC